jgi:hypothetical protein
VTLRTIITLGVGLFLGGASLACVPASAAPFPGTGLGTVDTPVTLARFEHRGRRSWHGRHHHRRFVPGLHRRGHHHRF